MSEHEIQLMRKINALEESVRILRDSLMRIKTLTSLNDTMGKLMKEIRDELEFSLERTK